MSDGERPVSLAARRASKAGDGRLWTPLDCLHDTVAEIERGEWRQCELIYVAMAIRVDEHTLRFPLSCAGGRTIEYMGLLAQHLHELGAR